MIICPNKECSNFKQELDNTLEKCPACGMITEKYTPTRGQSNINLGVAGIIAAFAGLVILWSLNVYVGIALGAAAVVLAIISKHKGCIIITGLLVLFLAGITVAYLDPFGWGLF